MSKIPEHHQQNSKTLLHSLCTHATILLHTLTHYYTQYIRGPMKRLKEIFKPPTPIPFSAEEIENSTRIQKSATPKYTFDWYLKWVASLFVLIAMSMRGLEDFFVYDMTLSMIGLILWLWVSILWKDRALILLNAVGFVLVLRNFLVYLAGV